ncbi:hypothetical protein [Methylobacter sp. YRD-M1]|uniref:hypothetical protein n=1 Tax=Methylobacter sp. YRD-M1 TaxID=2911520 RepID=UPI00227BB841|nr:hypothetical protein [Methylobacter sp. YRD-M1]WAK03975.1 zinc finger-like domain-containing protein [Methylobacter sp. YRD-M1]
MEEVIRFIQDFTAQEYEVMIQIRTEPDTRLVEKNLNALNQFFQGLHSGLNLSSSRTLEERDTVQKQLQPRVLFQIEQYAHPLLDTIYRIYLSSPFYGSRSYFTNFYIANTEKGLKIISRYNICNDCHGQGSRAGSLCNECHGFGWNWRGGQQLQSLGTLVAVRHFAHPADK